MRFSLFVCALALLSGPYYVHAANTSFDAEEFIARQFRDGPEGTGFLLSDGPETRRLELCFDQCDYFEWPKKVPSTTVWSYIAAFEAALGAGVQWKEYSEAAAQHSSSLVSNLGPQCWTSATATGGLSCDWARLTHKLRMKLGAVGYDEGVRCFAERHATRSGLSRAMSPSKCTPITPPTPWR
jgi:hypothetical protein